MKTRLLTSLVCALISAMSLAQSDVTKFLGIPVDGSVEEMVRKLEAKGFKKTYPYDESRSNFFTGNYDGDRNAKIILFSNREGIVYQIRVIKEEQIFNSNLAKYKYNSLVHRFSEKWTYFSANGSEIPEEEDIDEEFREGKSYYSAFFIQLPDSLLKVGKTIYDADSKPNSDKTLEETAQTLSFKLRTLSAINDRLDEAKNKGVLILLKQYNITRNYFIAIDYWNGYNDHPDEDL